MSHSGLKHGEDVESGNDPLNDWLKEGNLFKTATTVPGLVKIVDISIDEALQPHISLVTLWPDGDSKEETVTPEGIADWLNNGNLQRTDADEIDTDIFDMAKLN